MLASKKVIDTDPTGRYEKYDCILGRGAFKTVYRGFDREDCIEIAWNTVLIPSSPQDNEQLTAEVKILKQIKHQNIIEFHNSWIERNQVHFITEIMTSGTLKEYIARLDNVWKKRKVLKRWCRQILKGLDYLHSHDPPVIHRDLKCDNIFINGNSGDVKIGDLGLSTFMKQPHAVSVIGTPEFMAPELYDEKYDQKVDIYAFGMCILEMATQEYPYSECTNPAQIFKKVLAGVPPDALRRIEDPEVRSFVEKCIIHDKDLRPSAHDLLTHPFFNETDLDAPAPTPPLSETLSSELKSLSQSSLVGSEPRIESRGGLCLSSLEVRGDSVKLLLQLPPDSDANRVEIVFEYELSKDTPDLVAAEMIAEGLQCPFPQHQIANEIARLISSLQAHKSRDKSSCRSPLRHPSSPDAIPPESLLRHPDWRRGCRRSAPSSLGASTRPRGLRLRPTSTRTPVRGWGLVAPMP